MKGPFKADNPITSKIDMYKIWTIRFCKSNRGSKNKDPRVYV